jgi:lipoprotein-releasing system permease protein
LLARRLLRHQRGTFSAFIIRLAVGATALSVAVMILSLAFIGGFKEVIRNKLFAFWGEIVIGPYDGNSQLIVQSEPVQYNDQLIAQVRGVEGVTAIYPFAVRPGIIKSKGEMEGVRLKGVTQEQRFRPEIRFSGAALNFTGADYSRDILLSERTAARLDVRAGDSVRLYVITGETPRIRKLRVAGLYHTGMEEIDRQFALCDIRLVQQLSDWTRADVSGYQVELRNNGEADTTAEQIYYNYITPPMDARSIPTIYESVFGWLQTQDTNGRILLIIVGIVALINLASSMLILMVDRAVMIGLLKALGMAPNKLWALFMSLAGLISGLGLLIGNVIGLGLALAEDRWQFIRLPEETYNVSAVPVKIVWWQILALDAGTLILCVACTMLPLLYIRRIQPARVLHFR